MNKKRVFVTDNYVFDGKKTKKVTAFHEFDSDKDNNLVITKSTIIEDGGRLQDYMVKEKKSPDLSSAEIAQCFRRK